MFRISELLPDVNQVLLNPVTEMESEFLDIRRNIEDITSGIIFRSEEFIIEMKEPCRVILEVLKLVVKNYSDMVTEKITDIKSFKSLDSTMKCLMSYHDKIFKIDEYVRDFGDTVVCANLNWRKSMKKNLDQCVSIEITAFLLEFYNSLLEPVYTNMVKKEKITSDMFFDINTYCIRDLSGYFTTRETFYKDELINSSEKDQESLDELINPSEKDQEILDALNCVYSFLCSTEKISQDFLVIHSVMLKNCVDLTRRFKIMNSKVEEFDKTSAIAEESDKTSAEEFDKTSVEEERNMIYDESIDLDRYAHIMHRIVGHRWKKFLAMNNITIIMESFKDIIRSHDSSLKSVKSTLDKLNSTTACELNKKQICHECAKKMAKQ